MDQPTVPSDGAPPASIAPVVEALNRIRAETADAPFEQRKERVHEYLSQVLLEQSDDEGRQTLISELQEWYAGEAREKHRRVEVLEAENQLLRAQLAALRKGRPVPGGDEGALASVLSAVVRGEKPETGALPSQQRMLCVAFQHLLEFVTNLEAAWTDFTQQVGAAGPRGGDTVILQLEATTIRRLLKKAMEAERPDLAQALQRETQPLLSFYGEMYDAHLVAGVESFQSILAGLEPGPIEDRNQKKILGKIVQDFEEMWRDYCAVYERMKLMTEDEVRSRHLEQPFREALRRIMRERPGV